MDEDAMSFFGRFLVAADPTNAGRQWRHTRLGESRIHSAHDDDDSGFSFSLMSYNVLADKLMRDHMRELYRGESEQNCVFSTPMSFDEGEQLGG